MLTMWSVLQKSQMLVIVPLYINFLWFGDCQILPSPCLAYLYHVEWFQRFKNNQVESLPSPPVESGHCLDQSCLTLSHSSHSRLCHPVTAPIFSFFLSKVVLGIIEIRYHLTWLARGKIQFLNIFPVTVLKYNQERGSAFWGLLYGREHFSSIWQVNWSCKLS